MELLLAFGFGKHNKRNITPFEPKIQAAIGKFDIVANTRSFGAWANELTDGNTVNPYIQGSQNTPYWPSEHVICLNGLYAIDRIEIEDVGGGASYTIKSGLKFHSAHTVDADIILNQNQKRVFQLSEKNVKFISLNINHTQAEVQASPDKRKHPAEIRVYGKLLQADPVLPVVQRPKRTFAEMLGWNQDVFSDFNQNIYSNTRHNLPGTHFRIYDLPLKFMNDNPSDIRFAFSNGYDQGVDYDKYFRESKNAGITVIPTFISLSTPAALYKPSYDALGMPWEGNYVPVQANADKKLPASYVILSKFAFQFALRYGYLATDTSLAKCDPLREPNVLVGTGWCNRLELGNEQDNWFLSMLQSFSPAEFAAYISAIVDGHCGTMGPGCGALNADAEFEMIMPAFADYSIDYLMSMYFWWAENRADGKPPKFSHNFHGYFNDGGGQFVTGAKLMAPERFIRQGVNSDGGVRKFTNTILEKVKRYFPNTKIYLTEFGCDTNKYSFVGANPPTYAQAITQPYPLDTWQQQGSWTVRTILEFMADTSLDYTTIFTLNDYFNTNELRERYKDIDGNPNAFAWNTGGYAADIQFNTSGDQTGQYASKLATPPSPVNVATIAVGTNITLAMDHEDLQADYPWPPDIQLRDPADTNGSGAHLYTTFVSKTPTSLTVKVAANGPGGISYDVGGTFSVFRITTPFGKKTRHYLIRNLYQVLAPGRQLVTEERTTSEYRHLVIADSGRESHIIWMPTEAGAQITRNINFGRTTTCKYRDLQNKNFTDSVFALSGGSANVVINEVPKAFYFDLVPGSNNPPVVSVSDKNISTTSTTIAAIASDSDGAVVSYQWVQLTGTTATLSNTTTATLGVSGLTAGTRTFRCTVMDDDGATSFDDMTLVVTVSNLPPIAAFLGSINVSDGSTTVETYDNNSQDPDGVITGYLWEQISGPNTATLTGANTNHCIWSNLTNGVYVFRETVYDNNGASDTEETTVTMSNIGPANTPPVVNVENSRTIDGISTATITSTSSDPDGTIALRQWTKVSGGTANLINATTGTLSLTNLANGVYVFKLRVTDNQGAYAEDDMTLTVTGLAGGGGATTSQFVDYDHISAIGAGNVTIPTLVYLPINYGAAGVKFPVIVYCGGIEEKYDGGLTRSQNFNKIKNTGIPRYILQGHDLPCVVVMPMIGFAEFDSFDQITFQDGLVTNELAQYAIDHYSADPERCYLTGFSLGGQTVCSSAIANPNRWAACIAFNTYAKGYTLAGPVKAPFLFYTTQNDLYLFGNPPYAIVAWIDELNSLGHIPFTSYYSVQGNYDHSGWNEAFDLTAASRTLMTGSSVPNNHAFINPYTFFFQYKMVGGVSQLV